MLSIGRGPSRVTHGSHHHNGPPCSPPGNQDSFTRERAQHSRGGLAGLSAWAPTSAAVETTPLPGAGQPLPPGWALNLRAFLPPERHVEWPRGLGCASNLFDRCPGPCAHRRAWQVLWSEATLEEGLKITATAGVLGYRGEVLWVREAGAPEAS